MAYDRILVPLDGSDFAEHALPLALALAGDTTTLDLVSVVEPVAASLFIQDGDAGELGATLPATEAFRDAAQEARETALHRYLEAAAGRIRPYHGGPVDMAILDGQPTTALDDRIQDTDPDLVVMTTHGRGGLSRAWLGSVADGLVRRCHRPVLLARPRGEDAVDLDRSPETGTVLVPLDGSDLAEAILPDVTELCAFTGARCMLLTVVVPQLEPGSPYMPQAPALHRELLEEAEARSRGYLERVAADLAGAGVETATAVVVHLAPASAVLETAREAGIGLIAMATHGRSGLRRLVLGSVGDKVLRGADVPVMLRRPEEA